MGKGIKTSIEEKKSVHRVAAMKRAGSGRVYDPQQTKYATRLQSKDAAMTATVARPAIPKVAGAKAAAPLVLEPLVSEMVGEVKARVVACDLAMLCVLVEDCGTAALLLEDVALAVALVDEEVLFEALDPRLKVCSTVPFWAGVWSFQAFLYHGRLKRSAMLLGDQPRLLMLGK